MTSHAQMRKRMKLRSSGDLRSAWRPARPAERNGGDRAGANERLAIPLLNVAAGAANVVMLSNVPGHTVLAPYAAGSLEGVTPSYGTWATTDHMVGIALGLPLSRWLCGRLGAYRVLVGALVAYAAVSLMCAASETIWFFAPMRFLLGLIGGVALPLAQSVTLGQYRDDQRTLGVGFWGVMSMAPFTIGVFMGGFWAEYFNWRWLFYSNVVVALPAAAVIWALFYRRDVQRRMTRFDTIGFILLATVLLGVQTISTWAMISTGSPRPCSHGCSVVLPLCRCSSSGVRRAAARPRLRLFRTAISRSRHCAADRLIIQGLLSVFIVQLEVLLGHTLRSPAWSIWP
jgi:DHA2 family multidrug resistance protein